MGDTRWTVDYRLSLGLCSAAAEVEYCRGEFDRMQRHLDEVMGNGHTFEDKLRAYMTLILSLGVRQQYEKGIDTGIYVLKEMGFASLSKKVSRVGVLAAATKTKRLLRNHSQESLADLPILLYKKRIRSMRILERLTIMAYFSNINLFMISGRSSIHLLSNNTWIKMVWVLRF